MKIGGILSQAREQGRQPACHQTPGEEAQNRFSLTALRRSQPYPQMDLRPLRTQNHETMHVCAVTPLFVVLYYGSPGKQMHRSTRFQL